MRERERARDIEKCKPYKKKTKNTQGTHCITDTPHRHADVREREKKKYTQKKYTRYTLYHRHADVREREKKNCI
jgi:hypothetical protein